MLPKQKNPTGWRWRLILKWTGGQLEAIPLQSRLRPGELMLVRLGQPGAYNTVEVHDA